MQKLEQILDKIPTLDEIFEIKNDTKQIMSDSYTLLVKKINKQKYGWLAYGYGKHRNIVWGIMELDKDMKSIINISYGCRFHNFSVINNLLKFRRKDGYIVTSTIAKDRITYRILEGLLSNAYYQNNDFSYNNTFIDKNTLRDLILDKSYDYEEYLNEPNHESIMLASRDIAKSLLDEPNKIQIVNMGNIPKHILNQLHEFIEYSGFANINLPIICPKYNDCYDEQQDLTDYNNIEQCELYKDFSLT